MINKFKIWFTDHEIEGTTLDEWNSCPNEGVVAIVQHQGVDEYDSPRFTTYSGSDWYWLYDGMIYQNCNSTFERDVWVDCTFPDGALAKKGKWVSDERMQEVFKATLVYMGN